MAQVIYQTPVLLSSRSSSAWIQAAASLVGYRSKTYFCINFMNLNCNTLFLHDLVLATTTPLPGWQQV